MSTVPVPPPPTPRRRRMVRAIAIMAILGPGVTPAVMWFFILASDTITSVSS